jgi:hypothetical protein
VREDERLRIVTATESDSAIVLRMIAGEAFERLARERE